VPGSVLISYETFAHVKDEIECEEQGQIHVKGIAYPITTYRVVDLKTDLPSARRAIRAELPHLKLDRSYWRDTLREHGRHITVDEWWRALMDFQAGVQQQIQSWPQGVAARLGAAPANPGQPATGYLASHSEPLRQELARLLVDSPAGLGLAIGRLRAFKQRYERIRQALESWNDEARNTSIMANRQQIYDQQLQRNKRRLVDALRARPYAPAILWRVAIFWLAPLFLMTVGLTQAVEAPAPVQVQPQAAVPGWTLFWIAIYALILGLSKARIGLAKRRIERLVLEGLDRQIEHRLYSSAPGGSASGPLAVYLDAINDMFLASSQGAGAPSLLAIFEQIAARLQRGNPAQTSRARAHACVVYQSIGHTTTQRVLQAEVDAAVAKAPVAWTLEQQEVLQQLDSAAALEGYIRETLRQAVVRRYLAVVQSCDTLKLHRLLRLPESRALPPNMQVDDLRLRAKPLLGLLRQPHTSLATSSTLEFISADPETLSELLGATPRHGQQHLHSILSCDPFGVSYVTIVAGISNAAPALAQARGTTP